MLEVKYNTPQEPLYFKRVLRALKKLDPGLYEVFAANMTAPGFQAMIQEIKNRKPEMYQEIVKIIEAAERGEETFVNSPPVNVRERANEITSELLRTFDCQKGFGKRESVAVPVTIRLKVPELVVGLPREIMALSSRVAREHGSRRKWTMGFDNRIFVADLTPEAIEALRQDPAVESVEVEPMAHICALPEYNPGVVNTDWGVSRINSPIPWGKNLKGEKVKLAIIDTGIKSDHPAFWINGETNVKGGWNFVAGSNNPADDHDHGSFCAGIAAHRHNEVNGSYRGVAPNVELYIVKALDAKGSGSYANIAAGIDWCRTNGMDVISMSLGGSSGSDVLKQACDAAWYAGIVVVAAAGNTGPNDNTVNYPGKYSSVIAVAAVDYNENVANFSSRGPEVEVAGPGVHITGAFAGNTYHEYVVPGSNNLYMTANGTSAACPLVAALAALIKQWYPLASNTEIRKWLRDYARDL